MDGLLSALWAMTRHGDRATLQIKAAVAIPAGYTAAIHEEGTALLDFLAPDTESAVRLDRR